LLSCVWGATVIARIQFLLLEALRVGVLPWDSPWEVVVAEHDTDVSSEALADLADWFGRLRELHGESGVPSITHVTEPRVGSTHLRLDIAVRDPRRPSVESTLPVAWSRPANVVAPVPKRKFASRMILAEPPRQELVESFVQDYFRKSSLREGQYEILARILTGQDVVGLLPTGGGKSLTYQVAGLLLGGLTIYVSPLKSLLQDQHERLVDLGIELAQPISSALDADQRARANALLTSGGIRYLLIAPERFLIESFRHNLNQFRAQYGEVCQVVIDECHCVSEWGHDFRPAYLSLSRIVKERTERLGVSAPLIALTGTASTIVLADVQRELGIVGAESVIRARRLDRDEIALECVKLPQKDKHHAIRDLASRFLTEHPDPNEGLLVFCRFAGGVDGVLGVTADIQTVAGTDDIRFFCGSDPKWEQYAAIWTRTPARRLSREQVMAHVPNWALTPNSELRDWEDVKAEVQRQYISGLPGSFRVMVATNAFGMGIDKPSVRQVIHFMTPQAPEAYYQEVGRAGRDRKASSAILMFSDEEPALADELLSPERTIDEVRSTYKAFAETNRFKGGDFIRTFYFHQNAFAGPEIEVEYVTQLLGEIRAKLATESSLSFPYCPDVTNRESDLRAPERLNSEKSLEYAIVRLVLLGVVRDYVKDYNGKTFELELASEWRVRCDDTSQLAEYVWEHFQRYVRRYQFRVADNGGQQIRNADTVDGVERAAASAMVQYVYNQIERTRRQASRQMLELARKGVRSADEFRRDLMLYLQASEKFTNDLEALVQADDLHAWVEVVERVSSPDEVKELHGACSRVLESYPTHVGLLCISAVTRLARGEEELRLSEEELRAALRQAVDVYGVDEAKAVGDAVAGVSGAFDVGPVADGLRSVFGLWLLQQGRLQEAVERFFGQRRVRDAWLGSVLREARRELPPVEGL
jgi:ATP-dependent DNA helicase RecQ